MTRAQTQQTLRQLPVKWAVALLALIVVYALAQPTLNSRLGWNLPSLARLMGEPEPKKPEAKKPEAKKSEPKKSVAEESGKETKHKSTKPKSSQESQEEAAVGLSEAANAATENVAAPRESDNSVELGTTNSSKNGTASAQSKPKPPVDTQSTAQAANKPAAEPKTKAGASDGALLYGILKETGRDRYVSVEGLQYNPGSEEGHRLKHLERHLKDMPDRPGKHGVFDGEMKDALKWIDDAYARGKRGAKGVHKSDEENRTIYEAPFSQPIGYIGGRDGKRDGNPPARRLKLVVEGSKFITAFPF